MQRFAVAACSLLLTLVAVSTAGAQRRGIGTRWSKRSLTLPRQVLRLDMAPPDFALLDSGVLGEGYGLRFTGVDTDDADDDADVLVVTSGIGLAYGITSAVELGGKLIPVRFTPNPDYLDLELYLRWAFLQHRVADMGLQFALQFPTDNPRLFGMGLGLPIRIRMGEVARLDFGFELELLLWDNDVDDAVDSDFNLDVPVALSFSVTERFFLGGQFGLFFYDFDRVGLNGGGHIGYTFGRASPMVDVTGSFRFFGGPDRRFGYFRHVALSSGVRWEVMAGLRIHLAL